MKNKDQLAIKNAFEKINPNIIGIEILEDSLRINHNYPSREKAIIAARPVGEYFSKEVGRPVCVQVFYRNKNGSISDFQNAYAAYKQYSTKGARVKR